MGTLEGDKQRIGLLEDELRHRDARIRDLRQEVEEAQMLISELREQAQDHYDLIEAWKEAFDMQLSSDGYYHWPNIYERFNELVDKYNALVRQWNKSVSAYNAAVAPRYLGRPLAASESQRRQVLALRKAGKSLRGIVKDTGLGIRTIRTILGKPDGTDRTSKRTNELRKLELNRAAMATYRARKRTRDALPKQRHGQARHGSGEAGRREPRSVVPDRSAQRCSGRAKSSSAEWALASKRQSIGSWK
jgi:hypothetical protein